jgi:cytochrome c-type biogenesis protein CcsB
MENVFFAIAFTAYTVGASLYLGYALTRRESLARVGRWALVLAVIVHVISLGIRTYHARMIPQHGWYVPWSNWFESFSFFTAIITIEYLIIQGRQHLPILGAFVTPLAFASMVVAINSPFGRQIPTLPPALQSYWMAIHVPVMFVSYALFANAFAVGLAYLIQERQLKSKKPSTVAFRLPPLDELDRLIYRIIGFAFPILTLGVLLGARWAYDAWGRYWGWDAKETWAFITWVTYAVYLHMRLVGKWRGRKTAYLSLGGFAVVIFTYVGVNYLSELHGFLSGGGR